jgi:hypothetical protein
MAESSVHYLADERIGAPASYLTIERGDRVYDLYGWAAGRVSEPRIAMTRDEFFDGIVVGFRDRRLFVDAPEVRSIHEGVILLELTVADMSRVMHDPGAPPHWPGGPPQVPPRRPSAPAAADDSIALMASLSRMYAADRLSLAELEPALERVLRAQTAADLDAIAAEQLPMGAPAPRP